MTLISLKEMLVWNREELETVMGKELEMTNGLTH